MVMRSNKRATIRKRKPVNLCRWAGLPCVKNRPQSAACPNALTHFYLLDGLRAVFGFNQRSSNKAGGFISPAAIVVRPSQTLRLIGRIELDDAAVRPSDLPARRFVNRLTPGRAAGEQSALSFDHDGAHVVTGGPHEGKAGTSAAFHLGACVLSANARLAKSPAGQDEPDAPVGAGGQLLRPRPKGPAVEEFSFRLRGQARPEGLLIGFGQQKQRT